MRDPLKALGLVIRNARQRRSLSQESLAELAGVHRTYIGGVERGEYNISLANILRIARALELKASEIFLLMEGKWRSISAPVGELVPRATLLDDWDLSPEELSQVVSENPSLRGFLLGYVGEYKLRQFLSQLNEQGLNLLAKPDDHDRSGKGDILVRYNARVFRIELKSLQTSMVQRKGETFFGKAQCDASDRRRVRLPNGKTIETTCLLVGEFDVLAVNLYAFRQKWDFVFATNRDLPRSRHKAYSKYVRSKLLATLVEVTWPARLPFTTDLLHLLRELSRTS